MSDRAKPTSPPGVALSTRHTPRRHSLAAIGAVLTVVAGSVILTKAAVAEPFPGTWSVTMVSEGGSSDGEWIGKGFERSFDDGNASVHVDGTYWSVGLGVSGGTYGESFGFSFDSGTQGVFGPDFYTVDESAEAQPGRPPGMSISGEGRACNTVNGNFEVRDIAWSSTGRLERLWLLYEQRCSSTRALFGEIRLGMPTVAADVAPDAVRWPDNRVGPAIETVPVRVRPTATSPVTVSGVTLTGAHPEDFRIRLDQCTGRTLYDDDACEVFVRFTPQSPGPRSAVLRVATDAGIFPVRLDGNGPPGVTSWDLTSDPGDLVGRGDTFQYTSAVDTIWHTGTAQSVRGLVQAADTEEWDATFKPAQGEVLVAGATYPNTHEPTSDDAGPKMGVYRQWSFCGTLTGSFTVNNLDFLPTTGALDRLDVTFEQHCEGYAAALRGRIRYRDRADTAPPASVTGITATRTSDTPVHLTWTNPPDSDHAGTVVRYLAGENSPGLATVGNLAYTGTGSAVDIPGLTVGRAYTIGIFTYDTTGNVSRERVVAIPGAARQTISAPSTITHGSSASITGTLTDLDGVPLANHAVRLQSRTPGSSWSSGIALTTSHKGEVTASVTPSANREYRLVSTATPAYPAASSSVHLIKVRQKVTAALNDGSITLGQTVTIKGSVSPNHAGKSVSLQRYDSGTWQSIKTATLSSTSTFAFSYKPGSTGTRALRVYRPADADHASGTSPTLQLTISR